MAVPIAIQTGCNNVPGAVATVVSSGCQMFRSAFELSGLPARKAKAFGKCQRVLQPHWLATVVAHARLHSHFRVTNTGYLG
jgi:hypothetical protein